MDKASLLKLGNAMKNEMNRNGRQSSSDSEKAEIRRRFRAARDKAFDCRADAECDMFFLHSEQAYTFWYKRHSNQPITYKELYLALEELADYIDSCIATTAY